MVTTALSMMVLVIFRTTLVPVPTIPIQPSVLWLRMVIVALFSSLSSVCHVLYSVCIHGCYWSFAVVHVPSCIFGRFFDPRLPSPPPVFFPLKRVGGCAEITFPWSRLLNPLQLTPPLGGLGTEFESVGQPQPRTNLRPGFGVGRLQCLPLLGYTPWCPASCA